MAGDEGTSGDEGLTPEDGLTPEQEAEWGFDRPEGEVAPIEAQLDAWFEYTFGGDREFLRQFRDPLQKDELPDRVVVTHPSTGVRYKAPRGLHDAILRCAGGPITSGEVGTVTAFLSPGWSRLSMAEKRWLFDEWNAFVRDYADGPPPDPDADPVPEFTDPGDVAFAVDSPVILDPPVEEPTAEAEVELTPEEEARIEQEWALDDAAGGAVEEAPGGPTPAAVDDVPVAPAADGSRGRIGGPVAAAAIGTAIVVGGVIAIPIALDRDDDTGNGDTGAAVVADEADEADDADQGAATEGDPVADQGAAGCPLDDAAACTFYDECTEGSLAGDCEAYAIAQVDCPLTGPECDGYAECVADGLAEDCEEFCDPSLDCPGAGDEAADGAVAFTTNGAAIPPDCATVRETAPEPVLEAPAEVVVIEASSTAEVQFTAPHIGRYFPGLDGANVVILPAEGAASGEGFRIEIEPGTTPGQPAVSGITSNARVDGESIKIGVEVTSASLVDGALTVSGIHTDVEGGQAPIEVDLTFAPFASLFGPDAPAPVEGVSVELATTPGGDQVAVEGTGPACTEFTVSIFGDGQQAESVFAVTDAAGIFTSDLVRPPASSSWDVFVVLDHTQVGHRNSKD